MSQAIICDGCDKRIDENHNRYRMTKIRYRREGVEESEVRPEEGDFHPGCLLDFLDPMIKVYREAYRAPEPLVPA